MPHLFSILLAAILAGDLLWWSHADRLLRPLRPAFWCRLLIGLFMGGQVALVLWILGGRALVGHLVSPPPQALSAGAYLWHLLILPAAWALVVTTGIVLWVWRSGRRFLMRTTTGRQAPTDAESAGATAARRQFLGSWLPGPHGPQTCRQGLTACGSPSYLTCTSAPSPAPGP